MMFHLLAAALRALGRVLQLCDPALQLGHGGQRVSGRSRAFQHALSLLQAVSKFVGPLNGHPILVGRHRFIILSWQRQGLQTVVRRGRQLDLNTRSHGCRGS